MTRIHSKTFFTGPHLGQLLLRFRKTWYHYDRKSEIFNLSTLTHYLEFILKIDFCGEFTYQGLKKYLQKLGQPLLVIGQL